MQCSSQIITPNKPTPSFLQAGCPSCRQTNSVKALKGNTIETLNPQNYYSRSLYRLTLDALPNIQPENHSRLPVTGSYTMVRHKRTRRKLQLLNFCHTIFHTFSQGMSTLTCKSYEIMINLHRRMQAKYSRLFNLGEMSCFNQHNAVQ